MENHSETAKPVEPQGRYHREKNFL